MAQGAGGVGLLALSLTTPAVETGSCLLKRRFRITSISGFEMFSN